MAIILRFMTIFQQVKSVGADNIFLGSLIYYEVVYTITDALQNNMNSKYCKVCKLLSQ